MAHIGGGISAGGNPVNASAVSGVVISGTATAGQVLTALTSSTGNWQTPSGGSAGGYHWLVSGSILPQNT